jgi:hypothetical protein
MRKSEARCGKRDAHLLPEKESMKKMGVGEEGFTSHKVSISPPLHVESYTQMLV